MSLQARMSQNDPRLYNVYRDCAHNFGDVMRRAAARLEDNQWSEVSAYLASKGVTQNDLGEACKAACIFVQTATQSKDEDMQAALTRSGWFDVPEPAQVALCATVGAVMMGYFFSGVREATLKGDGPCQTYQDLAAVGERCHKLITMRPWRRWLFRVTSRLTDAIRALVTKK